MVRSVSAPLARLLLCLGVGSLVLAGRPAGAQGRTFSGMVKVQGPTSSAVPLTFDFAATDRPLLLTRQFTPAADGSFSVSDLPPGTYTVGIKGTKWLRHVQSVNLTTGNVTGLDFRTLEAGDVNDNNVVDVDDQTILLNRYNTASGDPNYDARADLNNDGRVNVDDLTLLLNNYNVRGSTWVANLRAVSAANGIKLTWTAAANVLGFTVYRSSTATGTYTAIASNVTSPTYTDTTPGAGGNFYKVSADAGRTFSNIAGVSQLTTSLAALDTAQPAWAEDNNPTDSVNTGGSGPSSATSIDVATGIEESHPDPDLDAYNPNGQKAVFSRLYRSAQASRGYGSPGLPTGWTHNYDFRIFGAPGSWTGKLTFVYPNGAVEKWNPIVDNGFPTGYFTYDRPGTPYAVSGPAGNGPGRWGRLAVTFKDQSQLYFTPSANSQDVYLLTRIRPAYDAPYNLLLTYDTANKLTRIESVAASDNSGTSLLTFSYGATGGLLDTITDVQGGRSVNLLYGPLSATNPTRVLNQVNQINSSSAKWTYDYALVSGFPLLTQTGVLNPTTTGNSIADVAKHPACEYDDLGRITTFYDANKNRRIYRYGSDSTEVESQRLVNNVYVRDLVHQQKFNAKGADTGSTDAFGFSSQVNFTDSLNTSRPTEIINRNGHKTTLIYDQFGNIRFSETPFDNNGNLQTLLTQIDYDYSIADRGLPVRVTPGNLELNQYLASTTYAYYPYGTIVNGVRQPAAALWKVTEPVPGATDYSVQQTAEYIYTAIGNVKTVNLLAPNQSPGGTPATMQVDYEYLNDSSFTSDPATYPAEKLGQPLRITSPRNDVAATSSVHFRYDSRGNVIRAYDELGNRTDFDYYPTNSLMRITFSPTVSGGGRASVTYQYRHSDGSGAVVSETVYDESGNVLRTVGRAAGSEDEFKYATGNVVQTFLAQDSLYRTTSVTNGKNIVARKNGFDEAGNFTGVTYADNTSTQVTQFDPEGNPLERNDGLNRKTKIVRSLLDSRVKAIQYPSDPTQNAAIRYDTYGRVLQVTDKTGARAYTYDSLGNVLTYAVALKKPNGDFLPDQKITYTYYTDGSRATMTLTTQDSLGSAPFTRTNTYAYNPDGTLRRQSFSSPGTVNYTYDAKGRLTLLTQSQINTSYAYNSRDFLTGLRNSSPYDSGVTLSQFGKVTTGTDIVYNALGLETSVPFRIKNTNTTDALGTVTYGYDTVFNLSQERRTLSTAPGGLLYDLGFAFDAANNPTNVRGNGLSLNNADQITNPGFGYNADGNLTQFTRLRPDGTTQDAYTETYDLEDRPTQLSSLNVAFNLEGQRAWKQLGTGNRTYFLYDGDRLLAELNASGQLVTFYVTGATGLLQRSYYSIPGTASSELIRQFAYDPEGHLVHRVRKGDIASPQRLYAADSAIYDANGGLWADVDFQTLGRFPADDPVGAYGQAGAYSDLELRPSLDATPLLVWGSGYVDPLTLKAHTRTKGLSVEEAEALPYEVFSNLGKGVLNGAASTAVSGIEALTTITSFPAVRGGSLCGSQRRTARRRRNSGGGEVFSNLGKGVLNGAASTAVSGIEALTTITSFGPGGYESHDLTNGAL